MIFNHSVRLWVIGRGDLVFAFCYLAKQVEAFTDKGWSTVRD
jgi:hypothetical protein